MQIPTSNVHHGHLNKCGGWMVSSHVLRFPHATFRCRTRCHNWVLPIQRQSHSIALPCEYLLIQYLFSLQKKSCHWKKIKNYFVLRCWGAEVLRFSSPQVLGSIGPQVSRSSPSWVLRFQVAFSDTLVLMLSGPQHKLGSAGSWVLAH